jgi:hypothetical protein
MFSVFFDDWHLDLARRNEWALLLTWPLLRVLAPEEGLEPPTRW